MELLGAAIIWLICGFACDAIAGAKGRNGCFHFLLGLFLGPFGVLITAILPPDTESLDRRAVKAGYKRHCIYCAEIIRHDAVICRYCGKENDPIPAPTLFEKLFRWLIH